MQKVILVGDFNHNDLDDEIALIAAVTLHELDYFHLLAVIANTNPVHDRARIAQGLLNRLGKFAIPVGSGAAVLSIPEPCPDLNLITYLSPGSEIVNGQDLILQILEKSGRKEITIVANAALTDISLIPDQLLLDKVAKVVFMGGVASEFSPTKYLIPGDAMNVLFDRDAASSVFERLQNLGIPMTVSTRIAAFAATLDHTIFDRMGDIGACFSSRVKQNTQRFWLSCCAPAGSPLRGMLGISRNRSWFIKTFCGDLDPKIPDNGNILPFIKSHTLPVYDAVNLIAAVDSLKGTFMNPKIFEVNKVGHEVIGWSPDENGIKDSTSLVQYLKKLLMFSTK